MTAVLHPAASIYYFSKAEKIYKRAFHKSPGGSYILQVLLPWIINFYESDQFIETNRKNDYGLEVLLF